MVSRVTVLSSLLLLAPSAVVALLVPHGTTTSRSRAALARPQQHPQLSSSSSELRAVEEASFGMGCFWEPAEELLKVDGILGTVSGYTGNKNFDTDPSKTVPTYENVCYGREWVEGVRVTYDTDTLSYEKLLDTVFETQNAQPGSRQYGSVIFPHDAEQLRLAERWKGTALERDSDGFKNEWTAVEYPRTKFYAAEGYHQNYWQKQRPRFALIAVLLAVATGFGDNFYDPSYQESVKTFANGATVVIGLAIAAERFLDSKVEELN